MYIYLQEMDIYVNMHIYMCIYMHFLYILFYYIMHIDYFIRGQYNTSFTLYCKAQISGWIKNNWNSCPSLVFVFLYHMNMQIHANSTCVLLYFFCRPSTRWFLCCCCEGSELGGSVIALFTHLPVTMQICSFFHSVKCLAHFFICMLFDSIQNNKLISVS